MTLFAAAGGRRITVTKIVTAATPVSIMDPSDKSLTYTIESMSVRLIGADQSFDFKLNNGTDNVCVAGSSSFGSSTYWLVTDHHVTIEFGKHLRFAAGGSTEMHVAVVLLESESGGPRQ